MEIWFRLITYFKSSKGKEEESSWKKSFWPLSKHDRLSNRNDSIPKSEDNELVIP